MRAHAANPHEAWDLDREPTNELHTILCVRDDAPAGTNEEFDRRYATTSREEGGTPKVPVFGIPIVTTPKVAAIERGSKRDLEFGITARAWREDGATSRP
jgi:hypothetical protein